MISILIFIIIMLMIPLFFNPIVGLIAGFKGFIIYLLAPFLHPFTIGLLFSIIALKIFLFFKKFIH